MKREGRGHAKGSLVPSRAPAPAQHRALPGVSARSAVVVLPSFLFLLLSFSVSRSLFSLHFPPFTLPSSLFSFPLLLHILI